MDVEWLILADSAQVVGNKLYLLGGGWDVITATSPFPLSHSCAVVASFRVPWNETNQKHSLELEILTEDGESLFKMQGQGEVGRPPGMPVGDQRLQLAQTLVLAIPRAGTYVLVARIEGQESRRTAFRVVQAAPGFQVPG